MLDDVKTKLVLTGNLASYRFSVGLRIIVVGLQQMTALIERH
jgi:hypothetical protein